MDTNYNPISLNTPAEDEFFITFSQKMRKAVSDQLQDNEAAMYVHLQANGFQLIGQAVDKRDQLSFLYEHPFLSLESITDNYGVDEQGLAEIRAANPISIMSCLECIDHLPDGVRRTFLRQLQVLRYLDRFGVGERVKLKTICVVLCGFCSHEYRRFCEEQLRAELLARRARLTELRGMPLVEYLKTPEWRALRNRALIRGGNRCRLCQSTGQLNVHHSS